MASNDDPIFDVDTPSFFFDEDALSRLTLMMNVVTQDRRRMDLAQIFTGIDNDEERTYPARAALFFVNAQNLKVLRSRQVLTLKPDVPDGRTLHYMYAVPHFLSDLLAGVKQSSGGGENKKTANARKRQMHGHIQNWILTHLLALISLLTQATSRKADKIPVKYACGIAGYDIKDTPLRKWLTRRSSFDPKLHSHIKSFIFSKQSVQKYKVPSFPEILSRFVTAERCRHERSSDGKAAHIEEDSLQWCLHLPSQEEHVDDDDDEDSECEEGEIKESGKGDGAVHEKRHRKSKEHKESGARLLAPPKTQSKKKPVTEPCHKKTKLSRKPASESPPQKTKTRPAPPLNSKIKPAKRDNVDDESYAPSSNSNDSDQDQPDNTSNDSDQVLSDMENDDSRDSTKPDGVSSPTHLTSHTLPINYVVLHSAFQDYLWHLQIPLQVMIPGPYAIRHGPFLPHMLITTLNREESSPLDDQYRQPCPGDLVDVNEAKSSLGYRDTQVSINVDDPSMTVNSIFVHSLTQVANVDTLLQNVASASTVSSSAAISIFPELDIDIYGFGGQPENQTSSSYDPLPSNSPQHFFNCNALETDQSFLDPFNKALIDAQRDHRLLSLWILFPQNGAGNQNPSVGTLMGIYIVKKVLYESCDAEEHAHRVDNLVQLGLISSNKECTENFRMRFLLQNHFRFTLTPWKPSSTMITNGPHAPASPLSNELSEKVISIYHPSLVPAHNDFVLHYNPTTIIDNTRITKEMMCAKQLFDECFTAILPAPPPIFVHKSFLENLTNSPSADVRTSVSAALVEITTHLLGSTPPSEESLKCMFERQINSRSLSYIRNNIALRSVLGECFVSAAVSASLYSAFFPSLNGKNNITISE